MINQANPAILLDRVANNSDTVKRESVSDGIRIMDWANSKMKRNTLGFNERCGVMGGV